MVDGVQVGNEETGPSTEQLEKEEEALRKDRAARHPFRHALEDWAGEHKIKNTQLNPDEAQRRYYRFTSNINLSTSGFRVKVRICRE